MRFNMTVPLVVCVAVVVALLWLSQLKGQQYQSSLTRLYKYLPQGEYAYLYSSELQTTLEGVLDHLTIDMMARIGEAMDQPLETWTNRLTSRCFHLDASEFLHSIGLQSQGEALLGIYRTNLDAQYSPNSILLVLNIRSYDAVLDGLNRYVSDPRSIPIMESSNGHDGNQYRVWRQQDSETGTLCDTATGMTIGSNPVTLKGDAAHLSFLPLGLEAFELTLHCEAVDDEGRTASCPCEMSTENSDICTASIPARNSTGVHHPIRTHTSRKQKQQRRSLTYGDWHFHFPEDDVVIVSNNRHLASVAAKLDGSQFDARSVTTDTRSLYQLRHDRTNKNNEILLGSTVSTIGLGDSRAAIAVLGTEEYLEFVFKYPHESMGIRVLEAWTNSDPQDIVVSPLPRDSRLGLTIHDKNAAEYLRFLFSYSQLWQQIAQYVNVGVAPIVRELVRINLTAVGFHILDYRDGVPLAVIGLGMGGTESATSVILDLQRTFRAARDRQVLSNALAHAAEHEAMAQMGDSELFSALLENSEAILHKEAHSSWESYSLVDGELRQIEELDASLFQPLVLNVDGQLLEAHYILPSITENDVRYRDEIGALDEAALRRVLHGEDRIVAYFDHTNDILWFLPDIETLQEHGESLRLERRETLGGLDDKGHSDYPKKVVGQWAPGWFAGAEWPEEIVELHDSMAWWLRRFERYEWISVTMDTAEGENATIISVRFDRRV